MVHRSNEIRLVLCFVSFKYMSDDFSRLVRYIFIVFWNFVGGDHLLRFLSVSKNSLLFFFCLVKFPSWNTNEMAKGSLLWLSLFHLSYSISVFFQTTILDRYRTREIIKYLQCQSSYICYLFAMIFVVVFECTPFSYLRKLNWNYVARKNKRTKVLKDRSPIYLLQYTYIFPSSGRMETSFSTFFCNFV